MQTHCTCCGQRLPETIYEAGDIRKCFDELEFLSDRVRELEERLDNV